MRKTAIGQAVRTARERAGFTQQQLVDHSQEFGLGRRTLQRIEAGEIAPSVTLLWAIADTLGVRVEELLKQASSYVDSPEAEQ